MKYVIYLRVSTDQQVFGMDAQRDICMTYINRIGMQTVVEYMDEGFSGSLELDKRPALLAAVSVLDKGDVLLIAKRDRIGRDPIVNAMIERAVERKKARLISASGDVRDDNDPSSILMKRMVDAFAEYERLIIGARTKAALQVKKKMGQCIGHVPFGYRKCTDNVHIEDDDHERIILQVIRNLRNEGFSFRRIAEELNSVQYFNRNNRPWNHVSVTRVMK